ncbi:histidine kinase [Streptomyces sp. MST-110588]|uniref:sensor histidine kinase n=1 Tax=Streptomyces sp. MST-110588 TaxID=2833628 RepID=UPI001F5D23A4|nr:histidine kinase [Streptomyces sp. MST-110588]UNO39914.1 two-component sensor histidine kinase [Streptomyces sp. MST-110588]
MSALRLPARPHRVDVRIAAGGLLGGLLLWVLGLHSGPPLLGLPQSCTLVALVMMSGAELLRRSVPLGALALAVLALALDVCTGTLLATVLMFTDVVYAAVLYGPPAAARRVPVSCVLLTVIATIVPVAVLREPQALLIGVVFGMGTVGPAWTGVIVRDHREDARSARLMAEQTALLAEMDHRDAVHAERTRMARELHDMVANHLSAIAIHATAAQAVDDPAATREALGVIRENSVQGLAEMRRLIGLLRDTKAPGGTEEPTATPTLDGLEALLARARTNGASSGLAFTLDDTRPARTTGDDGRPAALPAPVELAAYRIVQESLTNALKHAAPGEVTVALAHEDGGPLTVTVTSPYGDRPGPRAPGSGAGLVGMRERIALLGGTFEAGPVAGPGAGPAGKTWQVRAALPVHEEEQRR